MSEGISRCDNRQLERKGMKMKKFGKVMLVVMVFCMGTAVFAGPPRKPHREKNDGLRLANGIVNLVLKAVNPHHKVHRRPQPPPPPPRKHHRPAPPRHHR